MPWTPCWSFFPSLDHSVPSTRSHSFTYPMHLYSWGQGCVVSSLHLPNLSHSHKQLPIPWSFTLCLGPYILTIHYTPRIFSSSLIYWCWWMSCEGEQVKSMLGASSGFSLHPSRWDHMSAWLLGVVDWFQGTTLDKDTYLPRGMSCQN